MEVRLKFLQDPGTDYAVRICMRVDQAKEVVADSVERQCEECDVPVWYNTTQVLPPDAQDLQEVVLCLKCAAIHMSLDPNARWGQS